MRAEGLEDVQEVLSCLRSCNGDGSFWLLVGDGNGRMAEQRVIAALVWLETQQNATPYMAERSLLLEHIRERPLTLSESQHVQSLNNRFKEDVRMMGL